MLVKHGSIPHTIACDHRFGCSHSNGKRPIHEAEICPSVEHVEVDGHVQFEDLCDHRYHVCQNK